jgi:hypothetical protein
MMQGLELLKFNHAGVMALIDGSTMNYGVIELNEEKGTLIFFTGKGLREMWKPNMSPEEQNKAAELIKLYDNGKGIEQLKATGHIEEIPLNKILQVLY